MALLRIPFEEAIGSSLLLKGAWDRLSVPQQTVALTAYGLPLPSEEHHKAWVAFQELAVLDELGYPIGYPEPLPPYVAGAYGQLLFLCGRRGGKTSTIALMVAYEAALGAHEDYLAPGEQGVVFWVSQDQRTATINFNLVKGVFQSSPILSKHLAKDPTVERIDLKTPEPGMGRLSIMCVPPKVSSMRGPSCPVAVLDELVAWSSDPESADPDSTIYSTLRKAQITFQDRKMFLISSVGYRQGLIWDIYSAGTRGTRLAAPEARQRWGRSLVLVGTTAGMQNPYADRDYLIEERGNDDFAREYLSIWQDVESGAIDGQLLEAAIETGVQERPRADGCWYTATIDAAFRQDSFIFSICHADAEGGVTQDVCVEVEPFDGPLDPDKLFKDVIQPYCFTYGIFSIHADQYQAEALHALARRYNLGIERTALTAPLKAEMLSSFNSLLRQRRLRLLEHAKQRHQLLRLRKVRTENGNIQVRAPKGEHDDLALCLMLAIHKTAPMAPDANAVAQTRPRTQQDACFDQIMVHRMNAGQDVPEEWLQNYFESQGVY